MFTRYASLIGIAFSALVLLASPATAQTGLEVPEMAHYDTFITNLISDYDIPGASIAVTKDGRLVYARGFGLANTATNELVQPDAQFRIASISKPVTSVAVMKLIEDEVLTLDDPAFAYLPDLPPPTGQTEDPRLSQITIRDLLQHSGGWDVGATGYYPMFDVVNIAAAMGVPAPADLDNVVRYMRGRALDFDPGAKYAYSNFGYAVLGLIIEHVTGQSYEEYVLDLLAPTGISRMQMGKTLPEDRAPYEVDYYNPYGYTCPSVFPPHAQVPCPDGSFYIENMDAHGGWITSAPDLLRFMEAVDGRPGRPDILTPESIQTMTARPNLPQWPAGANYWYALGWGVYPSGSMAHEGALDGTRSVLFRSWFQGLAWSVLVNAWPWQEDQAFSQALNNGLQQAAQTTTTWPTHDLFDLFVANEPESGAPDGFALSTGAPNPFRDRTTFALALGAPQTVSVRAYDMLGREVAVLHEGPLTAGTHRLTFEGDRLPGGVYVLQVRGDGVQESRRVTLTR